tara:strand:+ start:3782 stop:4114 length:333 start_codon:yes stop_codon:yes gene_type:complete
MATVLWIVIALLILAVIAVLLKKGKHEPDYRTFFIIGVIFFIFGLGSKNSSMWMIGLVLSIVGLVHKNKWKKPKKWSELSAKDRKIKLMILGVLTLLVILGFVVVKMRGG